MLSYQIVSTRPEFQGRGICHRLMYESAQIAFQERSLRKLVIVAENDETNADLTRACAALSEAAFKKIWDNPLDAEYDKL